MTTGRDAIEVAEVSEVGILPCTADSSNVQR